MTQPTPPTTRPDDEESTGLDCILVSIGEYERLTAVAEAARDWREMWASRLREIRRLNPVVDAARALVASETTRHDTSVNTDEWLATNREAVVALAAAVAALDTPEADEESDYYGRGYAARRAEAGGVARWEREIIDRDWEASIRADERADFPDPTTAASMTPPLLPDWWRPRYLRATVRYPGICEHPRTSEITTLGEARPHVLCNSCGADWYGPGFWEGRRHG